MKRNALAALLALCLTLTGCADRLLERSYSTVTPHSAAYRETEDADTLRAIIGRPAAIESDRMKNVRMKGIVTAEEDVVRAMDRDIAPYSVDKVFNKDGSVSKSADWAVEEPIIRGLMDASEEKAGELCVRIRSGEIDAAPVTDGELSSCRYCEYHGICRARKEDERPLDKGITFRSIAAGEQRKNTLREKEK